MKRFFPIILLTGMMLGSLTSCEETEVTNNTFTFNVFYKHSRFIYLDIYPEANGFPYTAFIATLDQLERKGTVGLIDSIHAQLKDSCIYNKGMRLLFKNLDPGIEYYVCCYRMKDDHTPIYTKLVRYAFTTPVEEYTHMEFTWSAKGDTLCIHPNNNNMYYWDYELKKVVKTDYLSQPWVFHFYQISYYISHDMMSYMLSSGDDQECTSDYIQDIAEGDTLCLTAAPYNVRTNYSPYPQTWEAVYTAEGTYRFL